MARWVNGSALGVGDVLLDRDNLADDHPHLVVGTQQWTIHLRNCTSREADHLRTIRIPVADKTGDQAWVGRDSYLVISGETYDVATHIQTGEQEEQFQAPLMVHWMTPQGPVMTYAQPLQMATYSRMVPVYGEVRYRMVGTVTAGKMQEILAAL